MTVCFDFLVLKITKKSKERKRLTMHYLLTHYYCIKILDYVGFQNQRAFRLTLIVGVLTVH